MLKFQEISTEFVKKTAKQKLYLKGFVFVNNVQYTKYALHNQR